MGIDEWEPIEEGLEPVTSKRGVSFIEILLSKKELDTTNVGYQPPIPEDEVVERDDVANPKRSEKGGKRKKGKGKKGKKGKDRDSSKSSGKGSKGKKGKKGSKGKGKKGSKGKKGKGKGKKRDSDE